MSINIEFYRLLNNKSPVEDFLNSLTGKQAQKVLWVLRLIEELDVVPRQYFKKLVGTDNLWEVRIQLGSDIFRLLGFFDSGTLLILTMDLPKNHKKLHPKRLRLPDAEWKNIWQGDQRDE